MPIDGIRAQWPEGKSLFEEEVHMTGAIKGYGQAAAVSQAAITEQERAGRDSAGPAGGLLIAVGTSLILWAVIAQVAKLLSAVLF